MALLGSIQNVDIVSQFPLNVPVLGQAGSRSNYSTMEYMQINRQLSDRGMKVVSLASEKRNLQSCLKKEFWLSVVLTPRIHNLQSERGIYGGWLLYWLYSALKDFWS